MPHARAHQKPIHLATNLISVFVFAQHPPSPKYNVGKVHAPQTKNKMESLVASTL